MGSDTGRKVLLLGPSFIGGGAEKHFYNLAKHLFNGTCDVCLINLSDGPAEAKNKERSVINLRWRGRHSYPLIIYKLSNVISEGEYRCCLAMGFFPIVALYFASIISKRKVATVFFEITRPVTSMLQQAMWRRILYRLFQSSIYGKGDLFMANSADGLREANNELNVDRKRARRAPNIIDNHDIDVKCLSESSGKYHKNYIICVSRLVELKRIDTIIESMELIHRDLDIDLIIVGDGPSKSSLLYLANALGLEHRVTFLGFTENPFPYLAGASAYVLASEYEGFSNSVLEAMYCSVPVITSLCSQDALEMCHLGAALGFKVGSADELAENIKIVMTDQAKADDMKRKAKKYLEPHLLANSLKFYEETLSNL